MSDHAVEDITENLWNELFAAWCTRIGEREYAIVVFSTFREQERFKKELREAGERYLNVLDDLLNITGRLYIGSIEEKPRRIPISLQNALKLRFEEYREQESDGVNREQWDKTYSAFRNAENQSRMPHAVRCAIEYMKEYYSRDLTLQEVADTVELHPSYFSTLFNSTLNINFSNYLMCLRIRNAKRLLRETSMKIYEIADSVGYKNSYYFNRIFKKLTGMTPTEYRDGTHGRL